MASAGMAGIPPPSPVERLQALEMVEKEIYTCLQSAGHALSELAKDKPSAKQMEQHTASFLKTLNHVEMELTKHINYLIQVSTGQAHEGSSYAAQKVLQMAWHRTEHARSRVAELQKLKNNMLAPQVGSSSSTMGSGGSGAAGAGQPATPMENQP